MFIFVRRPNVKCSTLKPLFIYTFFADQIVFREKNVRSAAPYRGSQLEKSVPGRNGFLSEKKLSFQLNK